MQGYLTHKNPFPPRTLHKGQMVVLGGGGVSYERGTPVLQVADCIGAAGARSQVFGGVSGSHRPNLSFFSLIRY